MRSLRKTCQREQKDVEEYEKYFCKNSAEADKDKCTSSDLVRNGVSITGYVSDI